MGYPRAICSYVESKYLSVSSLASGIGVEFNKDKYTDFKFEFPVRDIPLGVLLFKYRLASFERNTDNIFNSWFLFYDDRGLVSCTFSDMVRDSFIDFPLDVVSFMGGAYTKVRDYLSVRYNLDHKPSKVSYQTWVMSLIGDKFDFQTSFPGVLGFRYRITNTSDEEIFSQHDRLVLIRQKYDTKKYPLPWTLTFGQLSGE